MSSLSFDQLFSLSKFKRPSQSRSKLCPIFKRLKHDKHSADNHKKTQGILGNLSKHGLLFSHDMAIHGPQNGPETVIFPNALFSLSLGIYRRFRPKVLSQTPEKALLALRSYSKDPNRALEKVQPTKHPVSVAL